MMAECASVLDLVQPAAQSAIIAKELSLSQIGYWRYISIYRHLQRNPDNQLYPLFEYFENWCQDENRHGDFFTAMLKSQPQVRPDGAQHAQHALLAKLVSQPCRCCYAL